MPHIHNRKTLSRYSKKELMGIAKEYGMEVNSKMLKTELVAMLMKNKQHHSSIPMKEKRKMSDKQRAVLEKNRFNKKQPQTPAIRQELKADTKMGCESEAPNRVFAINKSENVVIEKEALKSIPKEKNIESNNIKQSDFKAPSKDLKGKETIKEVVNEGGDKGGRHNLKDAPVLHYQNESVIKNKAEYEADKRDIANDDTEQVQKEHHSLTKYLQEQIDERNSLFHLRNSQHNILEFKTTLYADDRLAQKQVGKRLHSLDKIVEQARKPYRDFEDATETPLQQDEDMFEEVKKQGEGNGDKLVLLLMLKSQLDAGKISLEQFEKEREKLMKLQSEPIEEKKKMTEQVAIKEGGEQVSVSRESGEEKPAGQVIESAFPKPLKLDTSKPLSEERKRLRGEIADMYENKLGLGKKEEAEKEAEQQIDELSRQLQNKKASVPQVPNIVEGLAQVIAKHNTQLTNPVLKSLLLDIDVDSSGLSRIDMIKVYWEATKEDYEEEFEPLRVLNGVNKNDRNKIIKGDLSEEQLSYGKKDFIKEYEEQIDIYKTSKKKK